MSTRWDTHSWAFEGERAEAGFVWICEDLESQNRRRHVRLERTHNSLEGFFPFFLTSLWLFSRCAFPALGSHGIAQVGGGRGKVPAPPRERSVCALPQSVMTQENGLHDSSLFCGVACRSNAASGPEKKSRLAQQRPQMRWWLHAGRSRT